MISEMDISIFLLGSAVIFWPAVHTAMLIKYSFEVFAAFFQCLMKLLFSISIMSHSFLFALLETNGLTVFQKFCCSFSQIDICLQNIGDQLSF